MASDTSLEITLPDELYVHLKTMRWGASAHALAPTIDEWNAMLRDVDACVSRTYRASDDGICHRLSDLVIWPRANPVRLILSRAVHDVGSRALVEQAHGTVSDSPAVMTTSDRFAIEGAIDARAELLHWCQVECNAVTAGTPARGYMELRVASRAPAQGLTLFRLWIIDPRDDWSPFGLHRSMWRQAAADARGFGFRRQEHELGSRLVVPAAVETVWRTEHLPISEELPAIGDPRIAGTAVFALVSFDEACPGATTARSERRAVASRVIDQRTYLFLATRRGNTTHCLARATVSTWEARSQVGRAGERVVWFADPLLVLAPAEPAVSLMAPAVTILSRQLSIARFELSGGAIASRTLNERLDAGAAAWLGTQIGPANAPRLFAAGVAGAVLLSGEIALTSYVGINLGTLYDFAGGR